MQWTTSLIAILWSLTICDGASNVHKSENQKTFLRHYDLNQDGAVEKKELQTVAYIDHRLPPLAVKEMMQKADANFDNRLDAAEMRTAKTLIDTKAYRIASAWLLLHDRNNDSKISPEELLRGAFIEHGFIDSEISEEFKAADANGDGFLGAVELIRARQALRDRAIRNAEKFMEKYDSDDDGFLDLREAQILADENFDLGPEVATSILDGVDHRRDRKINAIEVVDFLSSLREEAAIEALDKLTAMDKNSDGIVTFDEVSAKYGKKLPRGYLKKVFTDVDINKNAQVDPIEYVSLQGIATEEVRELDKMRRKSQRKRVINAASQRASQAEPKMKAEQSSDTKHEYNSERTSKHLRAIRSSESRKKEKRIRHPKYIVSNGAKHYVLCTPRVTDSNGNTVHTVMDTRDYKVVKVRKVEDLGVFVLDDDGKKGTYDQGEIDNDGHIDICIESPVNENGDTVHSFVDDDGFQVNGLKKVDALGTYTLDDLVNANSANNKLIRETPTDIVVDENASDEEHSEIEIDDEKESDTSKNGVNEKGHQIDGNNAESNDSPSIEVLENHDQMVEKGLNSGKGENVRERYSEEDDFFEDDHLGDDHEEANKESDKNTITKGDVEVLESSDSEVRSEPKETTKKPCKNEMRSELKGSTKKPCKPKKGRREDEGEKEKILKNEEGINGKKKDKCKRGKHRNRCIKKNETLNKTTKSDEKGEDERGGMDTDGERDVRKELSDENERKKSPKPKEIVESSHTYTDVPDITEHFSSVSTERENIRATDSETKKKKHKKCKTSTSTTSKPHCRPHKRHREHNASDMKDSTTRHGLERLKDSPVLYDSDENLKLTRLRDEESADDDNGVDDDEINEDKSNRSDINKNNRNNDNEDAINSEDDDNDVSDSAGKTIQSDRILRLDLAKARQYGLISVPQRIGTAYSAPLSVADIGPNGFRI